MSKAEIYRDTEGLWRFRVLSDNGEVVAVGESYTSKADAERGLEDAARAFDEAITTHDTVEGGEAA